jgi:hypothetical protein
MSDEERQRLVGKLVLDHEQAKRHLAALQEQARAYAKTLGAIVAALSGHATYAIAGDVFTVKTTDSRTSIATERMPSPSDVAALLTELRRADQELKEFDARRREFGI